MFKSLLILSTVLAAFATPLDRRAWPLGNVTCGSVVYSLSEVKAAVAEGVSDIGDPVGSNSYPHKFNNYEGLSMWCTGKTSFLEFPIIKGGVYTGGSPGADRVVFSTDGVYCAVITHTGASGNNFVSCKGD